MNDQPRDPGKPTEQAAEWRAPAVNSIDEQPLLTRPVPRARRWRWIAVAVLVLAAMVAAWFWFGRGTEDPAKAGRGKGDPNARPVPVVAAPARKGTIDVYIDALGTVTPRNMVVVRTRVDGQLMTVAFREGQDVKAGDLLAQIDPRPFEVMLTQANGQMAHDQAQLKNSQLDLERYRTLLSQDSISKQQVDTQEALVRQYQGTIQADQAAIDSAKLQLTYSRVTAPIGGEAWDRDQKAKLAAGKLLTIDNQIDTTTGTVKLKAEFANTDLALFPN